MIASPFAFLGFALPKGGGFAQQWFDKLIGATFMAPAFIFMLYIDMLIIRGTGAGGELIKSSGADKGKLAMAFAGQITDFSVIYNFVLMVILLLASLTVAQKVSGGVGSAAGGLAKRAIGMGGVAAAATGAFGYRNIVARRATNKLNDKQLQANAKLTGKPGSHEYKVGVQARAQLEKYERLSKRTGDIRNSTVGKYMGAGLGMVGVNIGKGTTTTGYNRKEAVEKQEDDEIAKAKRLFPDNPEAQQLYLQERLGVNKGIAGGPGIYKVGNKDKDFLTRFGANKDLQTAYGEGRHKKMGEALDKEAKTKVDQESLKEMITDMKENSSTMTEAAVKEMEKGIQDLFTKLGGKDSLGALPTDLMKKIDEIKAKPEKDRSDDEKKELKDGEIHINRIAGLMNRQQVAAMAADPDKYGAALTGMTGVLMKNGTDDTRNYIIQQNKLGNPQLKIDANKELQDRVDAYSSHTATSAPTGTTPEAEAARKKYYEDKEKHDSAIQNLVGSMSPKEVARLPNDLKKHDAMVRNYNNKHFDEIESYHKNIKQDTNKTEVQDMFKDIRNNANNKGTKATQKYMKETGGKPTSAYYDSSIEEKKAATIAELRSKQAASKARAEAAKSKAFQAKIMGDNAGEAAAESEVTAAQKEHDDLGGKVKQAESNQKKTKKDNSTDDDEEEEREAEEGGA